MIAIYFFLFILGLIIGSFLNSVIYRLCKKLSFIRGRSNCPYCKHELTIQDLIPLVSFLLLKGNCRYCHKKISWQYPLVELGTAIIFILLFWQFGFSKEFLVYSIYSLLLIVIFVHDLKHYLVLDQVAIPAILIGFFGSLFLGVSLTSSLIGGIIGLGFFLIQLVISQGKWIGGGDLRLGLMAGFMVGWPNILLLLFFTYTIGALISIVLLIFKKKKWHDAVPLGVFLTLATLLVIFFGEKIIDWYLG